MSAEFVVDASALLAMLQGEPGADAVAAADLWHRGALALADRASLATARLRELPVVTADRAWAALDLDIEVRVIRQAAPTVSRGIAE